MFDWSKIRRAVVHCKTQDEANAFMAECEKHGFKWCTGEKPTSKTNWGIYGSDTAYFLDSEGISFEDCSYAEDNNCNILEYSDLSKPRSPRICYVLGGEDTPLKPFEKFSIPGVGNNPFHFNDDTSHLYDSIGNNADFYLPFIINHPENIIRSPQFLDDEEALMRLCGDNGCWQWYRENGKLYVKGFDEMYGTEMHCVSMKGITDQYTREKSFNAEAYLESEAKR